MIHWLRIKTINGMLRATAWLMGLPSPLGDGKPAPAPEFTPEFTPQAEPESPVPEQAVKHERYFVSYTFSCAWPHHNSPIRVQGGFGCSTVLVNRIVPESIEEMQSYYQRALNQGGHRNPRVIILCLTKIE